MLARLSRAALVLTLALGACAKSAPADGDPSVVATAAASASDEAPKAIPLSARFDAQGRFIADERILPAYRRNPTLPAAKGDQYDDIRNAAPQLYALTEPPERIATVRPMVEWEPMRAIVMSYPSYMLSSSNATATFVSIASHASEVGDVWFIVDGSQAESGLKSRIASAGVDQATLDSKIKFYRTDMDSVWFIDSGPLPIVDTATNTFAFADWRYYHERPLDDGVPTDLARNMSAFGYEPTATVYRLPLTIEGGTFQATTDGICFTSDRQVYNLSCYDGACDESLNDMDLATIQNHAYTLKMESVMAAYLGCKDLVITHSVTDDGTGHIDMYLKVLDDDRVLMGQYVAPYGNTYEQENAARLDANAAFLEAYVKPNGGGFTVPRIVMPGHRNSSYGNIPFTFINSTFFNGINLWPYSDYSAWDSKKAAAQATWDEVLPDYENIPVESTELSFYSGAIHCVTRTIPAVEATDWVADGTCAGDTCTAPEHGYDGECSPAGISEQVCWGPTWLCDCNDCENGCQDTPSGCGNITYWGCCDQGTLYYCDNNEVYYQSCGGSSCGWDGTNEWYDCGKLGADPSGEHPIACDLECVPDCDGKTCGADGCGGTCGGCNTGETCVSGQCESTCADAACTLGDGGCDGDTAWACVSSAGCPTRSEIDCTATGKICDGGQCVVAPVEPEPDTTAGPDTTTVPDTASTDGTPGPDTGGSNLDVQGGDDVQAVAHKKDGCAGGGGGSPIALALAGIALVLWRRRRRASV